MPRHSAGLRSLLALLTTITAAIAGTASAAYVQAPATSYGGEPLEASIEVDDEAVPGSLVITLTVNGPGTTIGDLRGFFLQVADETLVPGLSVSGPDVTGSLFSANGISSITTLGSYFNAVKFPCPCDLAVELGTPGTVPDDLQKVSFTLSHATQALDLSFLDGQEFGIFAENIGVGDERTSGSKLLGVIPEPGTALLIGLGLAGLSAAGTRSRGR